MKNLVYTLTIIVILFLFFCMYLFMLSNEAPDDSHKYQINTQLDQK